MKPFSRREIELLVSRDERPSVSFYLPTVRAGREVRQNSIRFKNLVRRAGKRLQEDRLLPSEEIDAFLAPASRLIDDDPFWQHQRDGLAHFLSSDLSRSYRLPIRFDSELAVVGRRFHIKPLLALLTADGFFHVLALNRKRIEVYECTRDSIEKIDTGDMPTSYLEVVGNEVDEQHLQFHTGTGPRAAVPGERPALFHGQGGGDDDVEPEIRRFLTVVDRHVCGILGHDASPLVLAGDDSILPLYLDVSRHQRIAGEQVRANPASLHEAELHSRAWSVVAPIFARSREEAAGRFGRLLSDGRASCDLQEIVVASTEGRVEVLFVLNGENRWGRFDARRREVRLADSDSDGRQDLLDYATAETLRHRGTVYAARREEMPARDVPLTALFRY